MEEDIDKPSVRGSYKKHKDSNIPEEYLNLYTRNVEIEDEEKSKERYVHLRDTVLYGRLNSVRLRTKRPVFT